jgi:hypothetical protein
MAAAKLAKRNIVVVIRLRRPKQTAYKIASFTISFLFALLAVTSGLV